MSFWLVIGFNGLLTAFNIYLVLRLWRWRQILTRVTRTLIYLERRLNRIFSPAPAWVLQGQEGSAKFRHLYGQLGKLLTSCRPFFLLALLGSRYYGRTQVKPRSASVWNLLGNLHG